MKYIMFTKHLEGLDVAGIMDALKSVGVEGADLCVRPGYPVNPENADKQLPAAAKQFADEGLSIPLVTTPTSFLDPTAPDVQRVYAACGEAGVANLKVGYWHWSKEDGGYWERCPAAMNRRTTRLGAFNGITPNRLSAPSRLIFYRTTGRQRRLANQKRNAYTDKNQKDRFFICCSLLSRSDLRIAT